MIIRKLHDKKDFGDEGNKYEIRQTFVVKYLGFHIDEELNFKCHIPFIEANVSRGVGFCINSNSSFLHLLYCEYITV